MNQSPQLLSNLNDKNDDIDGIHIDQNVNRLIKSLCVFSCRFDKSLKIRNCANLNRVD